MDSCLNCFVSPDSTLFHDEFVVPVSGDGRSYTNSLCRDVDGPHGLSLASNPLVAIAVLLSQSKDPSAPGDCPCVKRAIEIGSLLPYKLSGLLTQIFASRGISVSPESFRRPSSVFDLEDIGGCVTGSDSQISS